MSEISFHFNAPDKLGYACRVLRKAHAQPWRVLVCTVPGRDKALSDALWTVSAGSFIPHCLDTDAPALRAASPILICAHWPTSPAFEADLLLNLSDDWLEPFDRFARVIEVVTFDAADREHARERWRRYRALGIEPQRHDLNTAGSPV